MPAPRATLWLGYDGLEVEPARIVAVLHYRPAWDAAILRTYGALPPHIQAVVVTEDGAYLPARRPLAELHARWVASRAAS